jgi:hypothetical protein
MTRKDYKIIATAIFYATIDDNARANVVLELSSVLKKDNANFDDNKFAQACGVPNDEEA